MARCLAVYEAHGDMVGIAAALQNRALTSFLTAGSIGCSADFKRIIQIAREYGFRCRSRRCCAIWARSTS